MNELDIAVQNFLENRNPNVDSWFDPKDRKENREIIYSHGKSNKFTQKVNKSVENIEIMLKKYII